MRLRSLHSRWGLRPRLPGRTVRSRLTWLYGALFLAAGAVLLVIVAALWGNATDNRNIFAYGAPGRILTITGLAGSSSGHGVQQVPPYANAQQGSGVQQGSGAQQGSGVQPQNPVTISRATTRKRGKVIGQLQVLASQQHNTDLHELLLYSGLALGIMAILSILLGWLTAGRVLRPLRTITGAAQRISASNLHERLALEGPSDELKELGDTFDQLLSRLERAFQSQRQFVANASHELRTPLATMRASVDVALAKPKPIPEQTLTLARHIGEELDQVDRLIEGFLALARAQAGLLGGDVTMSLDRLINSALLERAGSISGMRLDVDEDGLAEVTVIGSETLVCRMVENLIDNAVRHNDPGGWIRVCTGREDDTAYLLVENGGRVLDEEAVSDLAAPFRRLGVERTRSEDGFGLGLSIVASIAETHGGRLQLHALEHGGFQARVELPLPGTSPEGAPE